MKIYAGLLALVSIGAIGQTKVDLGSQSKNIDFSQATAVKPFPAGTALPATCSVGQVYFLTTSPVGANECVAANSWSPIQGTSSGSTGTGLIGVTVNGTQMTIGPSCSIATPCIFRIGSTVYSMPAPATATLTSGSGPVFIYVDANGNLTVGVGSAGNPAVSCAGCVTIQNISQYPLASLPIETWTATSGAWDPAGNYSAAPLSGAPSLIAGQGISLAQTGSNVTISTAAGQATTTGPISGYNPQDPTQWFRDHLSIVSGFSKGADSWGYSNCSGQSGPSPGFTEESVITGLFAAPPSAGATCFLFFPYGASTYDYWSGAAPASLWVQATYQSQDTNGTHYVGLSNGYNDGPPSDFIGCRQTGAGHWFAVIRSGGADVATADTGVAHDTNTHRVVVDNNSGAANVIRCSVDGSTPAVANGGLPAEPFGWLHVAGASTSALPAIFALYQYTIFLQNLPRQ